MPSEEDYSKLRGTQKDAYDRLHYIPLAQDGGDSFLTIGGQVRQWYESFSNPPFGKGPQDANGYLLQRYMVHFDAHFNDRIRVFAEFKGNLENGRTGGPRPDIDEDRGDLHQAFADVTLAHPGNGNLTLRVGRQEMVYGSGRFVDMREGPNVRRGFDGAKLTYCSAQSRLDVFAAKPVENPSGAFDDKPTHGTSFWGIYATRLLPLRRRSTLDVYYFGFDQKSSRYVQALGREQRHTVGARLSRGGRQGWDQDYEAITQFGRFAGRDIRAWAASSDTGYRFDGAKWKPRLGAKLDVASGDSGAAKGDLGTWNPLFASLHYFGEEGLAGPSNFYDIRPELELHPKRNVRATFSTDWFWRQKTGDGIYLPGPLLLVSPNGSKERYIGNLSAVEVEWDPSPHWVVTGYYSRFQSGAFVKEAASGVNTNYVAGWVTFHF